MSSHGGLDPTKLPIPPRVGRDDPLSRAQEAMWFLNHLAPDSAVYNLPSAIRLRGPLDERALWTALDGLVRRHTILRTVFESVGGKPRQRVLDDFALPRARMDVESSEADTHPLARVEALIRSAARAPFDFAHAPPWQVTLYRIAADDHVLGFVHHHLVWDGWSIGVMIRELESLYAAAHTGVDARLEPLALDYGDFARWEREWVDAELLERRARWWKQRLRGHDELRLPLDRARPREPDFRGAVELFRMREPAGMAALLERSKATPYMVLLAGFAVVLARWSAQRRFMLGTPFANRGRPDFDALIGHFATLLVLPIDVDGDPSFAQLVLRTRDMVMDVFGHADVPFDTLVEQLGVTREAARNPIFQVSFGLHGDSLEHLRLAELEVTPVGVGSEITHFDLSLHLWRREGWITGYFSYARELFDATTITRLAEQLATLIEAALNDPDRPLSRLEQLPASELAWLQGEALTQPPPAPATLDAVRRRLAHEPERAAFHWGEQPLARRELAAGVQSLATQLAGRRVIAAAIEPSPELALVGLACLWAGVSLLLLERGDIEEQRERIADAGAELLLLADADPRWPDALPIGKFLRAKALAESAPTPARADAIALISSAGGRPLALTRAAFDLRVAELDTWLGLEAATSLVLELGPSTRWLSLACWALARGVCIVRADAASSDVDVVVEPEAIVRFAGRARSVTVFGHLDGGRSSDARTLGCPLRQLYAPAELERELGLADVEALGRLRRVERARVKVLDRDDRLAPIGVEGRVTVDGVATRERGRWRSDGTLELLGLAQGWAEHRGVRIDLDALASRIVARVPDVADAAVQVIPGEARAAAGWLVSIATVPEHVEQDPLEAAIAQLLPAGAQLLLGRVSHIPLDAEGRVDRDALRSVVVVDAWLRERWLTRARELPGVEDLRAAIVPDRVVVPLRHLGELLPGLGPVAADEAHSTISSALDSARDTGRDSGIAGASEAARVEQRLAYANGGPLPDWDDPPRPTSLVEAMLRAAAASVHTGKGLTFVELDGSSTTQRYDAFVDAARRTLTHLRALGLGPGDRVVLHQPRLADHFRVFWACLLGGITPVTVARPPSYEEPNALLAKLRNAWRLLGRPPILASAELCEPLARAGALYRESEGDEWVAFRVLAIDELDHTRAEPAAVHMPAREDVVFWQLTSGSTGIPKVIPETNRAVLAHAFGATALNGYRRDDVILNWLPTDHVAPILMSHGRGVVLGAKQVHVMTAYILADPLRWLDLMHEHRVSLTWSPNFGFRQVADAVARAPSRSWELSCVRMMMNAGEQVTLPVVRDFLERLAPFGIRESAMQPAYGMAETATAMVYANDFSLARPAVRVRKDSLTGTLREVESGETPAATEVIDFIDLGPPIPGVEVRIAGPDLSLLPEMTIGMVQMRGDVILPGYLDNDEANAAAFPGDGWFDSGDLGFLRKGRLFITGRRKETIIIRGANFYCYEIEDQIESVAGVEPTFSAAVAVDEAGAGTEGLAVFFVPHDAELLGSPGRLVELVQAIAERITREFGVRPRHVLPLGRDAFPKTTSGKIQRGDLKRALMRGDYDELIAGLDLAMGAPATTVPEWFMRWSWRVRPLVGEARPPRSALVIADTLADALAARLPDCELVRPGRAYAELGERRHHVAAHDPGSWAQLLARVPTPSAVVYALDLAAPTPDDDALQQVWCVLALLQALAARQLALRVVIASAGALATADEPLVPARAALRGLLATAAREWPKLALRHVDFSLEPHESPQQRARLLARELEGDAEPLVAWRSEQRLVARLAHLELAKPEAQLPPPIREGSVVLLTGGLGGVGVRLARLLLTRYRAKLLVLGRSDPRERIADAGQLDDGGLVRADLAQRSAALRELEALPGELHYMVADVCDRAAVAAAFGLAKQRWGEDVAGVFHLAGHSPIRMLAEESAESFAATCRPKLDGAALLLEQLGPEGFFVAASSVYACFGATASGAYAAANSALEGWAASQRASGRTRCHAYTFSYWDGVGMSRGYAFREQARELGYFSMDPRQALHSLLAVLARGVPDAVIGVDRFRPNIARFVEGPARAPQTVLLALTGLESAAQRLREQTLDDRLGHASRCRTTRVDLLPLTAGDALDWRALGSGRGSALVCGVGAGFGQSVRPRTSLERVIAAAWSEALGIEDIDIDQTFFALGGQSLQLVAVLARLEASLNRELSIVEFFRYPTIRSLAEHLGRDASERPSLDPAKSRGQQQRRVKRRDFRQNKR